MCMCVEHGRCGLWMSLGWQFRIQFIWRWSEGPTSPSEFGHKSLVNWGSDPGRKYIGSLIHNLDSVDVLTGQFQSFTWRAMLEKKPSALSRVLNEGYFHRRPYKPRRIWLTIYKNGCVIISWPPDLLGTSELICMKFGVHSSDEHQVLCRSPDELRDTIAMAFAWRSSECTERNEAKPRLCWFGWSEVLVNLM